MHSKTKVKLSSTQKEEELDQIFLKVKKLIKKYSPPLTETSLESVSRVNKDQYGLWSQKEVVIAGRVRFAVYFAGIIRQKGYVGFYFMPVYTHTKIKKVFHPDLLKLLKGKSCFYIKVWTPALEKHIKEALQAGFMEYRKNKWI